MDEEFNMNNLKASISGDFVKYKIFFDGEDLTTNQIIEKKEKLNKWVIDNYTKNHMWQKEEFKLNTSSTIPNQKLPPHLMGITYFGDNLEDEWFIVYILKKMSEENEDISITVEDNDGQFLLIETAMYIPRWMEPNNTKNKVFIRRGKIHIIPLPSNPSQMIYLPPNPDLRTSLSILQSPQNKSSHKNIKNEKVNYEFETEAKMEVQNALQTRIERGYDSAKNSVHHANAYLPRSLAFLLTKHPKMINKAIESFYYRDYDDMKSIQIMKQWNPKTKKVSSLQFDDEWILSTVKFTRCLFAQITKQNFYPPKIFLSMMPSSPQDPLFKPTLLGIKIVCGFEMYYQKSSLDIDPNKSRSYNPKKMLFDWEFDNDLEWTDFYFSLKKNGFFSQFSESSKEYQNLLKRAKFDYVSSNQFQQKMIRLDAENSFKTFCDNFISDCVDQKESLEKHLNENLKKCDDKDDWLNITPEQVDDMLFQKQKEIDEFFEKNKSGDSDLLSAPSSVKEMLNDVKSFVNKISSFEGAEFPNPEEKEKKKFSTEKFFNAIKKTLGVNQEEGNQNAPSFLDDYLDMDDSEEQVDLGGECEDESFDDPQVDKEIKMFMDQMDLELQKEKSIAQDFEKIPQHHHKKSKTEKEQSEFDDTPQKVDIDLNLVKNILESFEEQNGSSGPLTNILSELKEMREKSKN